MSVQRTWLVRLCLDRHDSARCAFCEWVINGKPRSGWLYMNMYKTRTAFKQALRYCRKHETEMKADSLAKFSNVNKIGACVGEHEICEMWKDHFKSLYNSVPDGVLVACFNKTV